MEIYDDPAMALFFSIVENSTDCNSSDAKIDKVVEKSFVIFNLSEDISESPYFKKQRWAYLHSQHLMKPLHEYIIKGGNVKQFCEKMNEDYIQTTYGFLYYRKLNNIKLKELKGGKS